MIDFYPTVSRNEMKWLNYPRVLLTASSFAAANVRDGKIARKGISKVKIPSCVVDDFRDCGGFVATFKWGGKYPYSPQQYIDWLSDPIPTRAAMMDLCCEKEIALNTGIVKERQNKTTENAYYFWQEYKKVPWQWVPTIQGWHVSDYIYHASQMKTLLYEMKNHYSNDFRVGIGTLCHRASPKMVNSVVSELTQYLPGINFHLWGVKKTMLTHSIALPQSVVSVDSAAFNGLWGKGRSEWKEATKEDGSKYKQGEWSLRKALPEYIESIHDGLSQIKQQSLF